jgi:hypothetical protein
VRRPARPCRSRENCQAWSSSTDSMYRWHASSSESKPPRTAVTTSALRRITQRVVSASGRSSFASGSPSYRITYFSLPRRGSVIGIGQPDSGTNALTVIRVRQVRRELVEFGSNTPAMGAAPQTQSPLPTEHTNDRPAWSGLRFRCRLSHDGGGRFRLFDG